MIARRRPSTLTRILLFARKCHYSARRKGSEGSSGCQERSESRSVRSAHQERSGGRSALQEQAESRSVRRGRSEGCSCPP